MNEQELKVLGLCREWYRTAKDITKQSLWYEIGVMLENEPSLEQVGPEKVYITTELISNLNNAAENGYAELGETDLAELLLLCEKSAEHRVQSDGKPYCPHCDIPLVKGGICPLCYSPAVFRA